MIDSETRPPSWLGRLNQDDILDVRPLIRSGNDPLAVVVRRAEALAPGGGFLLDAPFDPLPLRRVLGGKGISSHAWRVAEGHWRLGLLRDGAGNLSNGDAADDAAGEACGGGDAPMWDGEEGALHIDVRGLGPPLPMLAILRAIHGLREPRDLVVHHEREPQFLIPELAEIGWSMDRIDGDPGEIRLRLRKAS